MAGPILVAAAAAAISLLAWTTAGEARPTPPAVADQDPDRARAARPATVLQSVPFHRAPGGPAIRDEFGENEELTRAGQLVTILEEQVVPGSGQWVRVFVEVDPNAWPGDFYAWLPVAANGKPVLEPQEVVDCPADLDLDTLAPLVPSDRLRCAGDKPVTMEARTVFEAGYCGLPRGSGVLRRARGPVGRHRPGAARGGTRDAPGHDGSMAGRRRCARGPGAAGGRGRPADRAVRPPCCGSLPPHCRDPGLRSPAPGRCRAAARGTGGQRGLCRRRFVITGWTITAGPERQPPVPGQVQLHRSLFGGVCAGVGMDGPLAFRIDLAQPDPVWIERAGGALRIIPRFSNRFSFVKDPEPGISDGAGLVIRDGTTFDPEIGFAGHSTVRGAGPSTSNSRQGSSSESVRRAIVAASEPGSRTCDGVERPRVAAPRQLAPPSGLRPVSRRRRCAPARTGRWSRAGRSGSPRAPCPGASA